MVEVEVAGGGPAGGRLAIAPTLKRWREDPGLASVREAHSLAKLPEGERDSWRALWREDAVLLERALVP